MAPKFAKALHDFEGDEEEDLSFAKDALLTVTNVSARTSPGHLCCDAFAKR